MIEVEFDQLSPGDVSRGPLLPDPADEKRWVDGVLAQKKGLGFG